MSKLLILALFTFPVVASSNPQNFTDPSRFKEYNVSNTNGYILKDNKTGCEYYTRKAKGSYVLLAGTCDKDKK